MQASGRGCSQSTLQKWSTIDQVALKHPWLQVHIVWREHQPPLTGLCGCCHSNIPLPCSPLAGTQFSESVALVLLALAQWLSFLKLSVVLSLPLPLRLKIASRALHPAERMTLLLNYFHGMQVKKYRNNCLKRSSHNNLLRLVWR